MAIVKKNVKPIAEQAVNESRFMWKEVTAGLKYDDLVLTDILVCHLYYTVLYLMPLNQYTKRRPFV